MARIVKLIKETPETKKRELAELKELLLQLQLGDTAQLNLTGIQEQLETARVKKKEAEAYRKKIESYKDRVKKDFKPKVDPKMKDKLLAA